MADSTSALDSQYNSAKGVLQQSLNKGGSLDKESFLLLLVTQFQHQDPLNPMDDKEFVAQLAQFSSLEQAMTTNENLTSLLEAQQTQQSMGAVSYIGKQVLARGYGVSVEGDTVSEIKYALGEEATKGFINIFDSNNQLVTTVDLPALGTGIHTFKWDGRMQNGSKVPEGVYTVSISCTNSKGEPIIADTEVSGKVTAVSNYEGEQYLRLSDGRVVALKNVREVVEAKAETKPDDTNTNGNGSQTG